MLRLWGSVCAFLAIAGATVLIILVQSGVWDDAPPSASVTAAVLLGLVAGHDVVMWPFRTKRQDRRWDIRTAQAAAVNEIERLTGIPSKKLGMCCYLVPGWFRVLFPYRLRRWLLRATPRRLHRHFPRGPKLIRMDRLRQRALPETAIDWRYGTGLIGKCWKDKNDLIMDFVEHYGPWIEATEAQWENDVDPEIKLGLTYREFRRIRGRYGTVLVSPITQDNEFVGCLTLDTPYEPQESPQTRNKLWTHDVRSVMGNAAEYIKRTL